MQESNFAFLTSFYLKFLTIRSLSAYNLLALNLYEGFWDKEKKLKIWCQVVYVVHTAVKQVISRCGKDYNGCMRNVQKGKTHVQRMQNDCFALLNRQICKVFVAFFVVIAYIMLLIRAVFKWLSKNQNQSNYSDQSQQERTTQWTNQNS